jgi:flagellar basal-body rod protein FlgF
MDLGEDDGGITMADGIYVSMCGAVARQEQLESVADNLANIQTRGFKASRPAFESFLPAGGGYDKSYAAPVATAIDLRPGPTTSTGNTLDVVPSDGAFFAVLAPGGRVAYTRDGHMGLDAGRRLVIGGNPVLGRNGAPIVVPSEYTPEILPDGRVRGALRGSADRGAKPDDLVIGELATFRLTGVADRVGPSLLLPGRGGQAVAQQTAQLAVGEVELANVSALETTVQMITAQRSFDASMQALQTYRTMDQRAAELGRTR